MTFIWVFGVPTSQRLHLRRRSWRFTLFTSRGCSSTSLPSEHVEGTWSSASPSILQIICVQSLTVSDLSLNCLPEISWYQLLCLSSGNTSVTNCSSWTLDTNKTSLQLQVNDNDDEWSSSLSDAIMVMSLRKGRLGTCWSDRLTIDMRKTFVTRAVITYHQKIANVV